MAQRCISCLLLVFGIFNVLLWMLLPALRYPLHRETGRSFTTPRGRLPVAKGNPPPPGKVRGGGANGAPAPLRCLGDQVCLVAAEVGLEWCFLLVQVRARPGPWAQGLPPLGGA